MPVFTVCFFIREQESIPVGGCVSREMGGKYPGGVHTQTPLLDPEADTPPDSKVDTPLEPRGTLPDAGADTPLNSEAYSFL